ncbi:MAG: hypothetical protein QNJ57_04625 [Flavobacteriaceae bacterium]|nr:hypothetical protein [Flavobacteriaceae bacterium]
MISHLPDWINLLFIITCLLTLVFFYLANGKPKILLLLILIWSILISVIAYKGFLSITDTITPRFALILIPTTIAILFGLRKKQIEWVIVGRNLYLSTMLHIIRIPVEIVLFYLFLNNMIPELMTFEGRNFDIIAGITAPVIAILFAKRLISKKVLLVWNFIGLGLVSFILINGILSAELPFQQFAFDQPNKAVNYFPFVLLPATIVPIVIYTHITDIIKLLHELKSS